MRNEAYEARRAEAKGVRRTEASEAQSQVLRVEVNEVQNEKANEVLRAEVKEAQKVELNEVQSEAQKAQASELHKDRANEVRGVEVSDESLSNLKTTKNGILIQFLLNFDFLLRMMIDLKSYLAMSLLLMSQNEQALMFDMSDQAIPG